MQEEYRAASAAFRNFTGGSRPLRQDTGQLFRKQSVSCERKMGRKASEALPEEETLREDPVYLMAVCDMFREGSSVPVNLTCFWLSALRGVARRLVHSANAAESALDFSEVCDDVAWYVLYRWKNMG